MSSFNRQKLPAVGLALRRVEPDVRQQALSRQLTVWVKHLAIRDDYPPAVPDQASLGCDTTVANGRQIVHLQLDRCKPVLRLRGAYDRKRNRGVYQGRDRSPMHYALELKQFLADLQAQART